MVLTMGITIMPTANEVITVVNESLGRIVSDKGNASECQPNPYLVGLTKSYQSIHGYLALIVCVTGTASNLLNAVILTREAMRNPTNTLLTVTALMDSVKMIAYGMQTLQTHIITSPDPEQYPHPLFAVYIMLVGNAISIVSHIISTILLVQLAAFRYWVLYSITYKLNPIDVTVQKRTVAVRIVVACSLGLIIGMPRMLLYTTEEHYPTKYNAKYRANATGYWIKIREGAQTAVDIHFLVYGCLVKLLASGLIFILTCCILVSLRMVRRRYMTLKNRSSKATKEISSKLANRTGNRNVQLQRPINSDQPMVASTNNATEVPSRTNHKMTALAQKNRKGQKVTVMLIVVVISFVVTEVPQGIVNTMVTFSSDCFFNTIYDPLGDALDLSVLVNSSINFILYCTMSQMFRANFLQLIRDLCHARST